MATSKWAVPPEIGTPERREYDLDLHNHIYGLGTDLTGQLNIDNAPTIHIQGTDQYLDQGGINQSTAVNVKDAVTKKHTQGTDQFLDQGGANQVTVANAADAVTKKHDPGTNHKLLLQAVDPTNATASTVSVTSADATDLATVITLANEIKGDVNTLVTDVNNAITKLNSLMANMRTGKLIA